MTNTNSTLSSITQEMSSTDSHVSLGDMIFDHMTSLTQTQREGLSYTDTSFDSVTQFHNECEMYIWGQYVLHGSIDQTSPIIGRNLYKNENNTTIVSDYFIGEIECMIEQFVSTRLSYV